MSYQFTKYVLNAIAYSVALLVSLSSASALWAQSCHTSNSGGSTKAQNSDAGQMPKRNLAEHPLQPQHNGQVTTTKKHYFEVVYLPKQTRVYVYLPSQHQMNIRNVKGELTMRVNGNPQEFRYPLKPAFERSVFSNEPGYLAANIEVSRVPDGAMQVAVALENLLKDEPNVQFTQTFALSRPRPQVTVSQLTEADRPLIQRQRICPVMDAELGGHGEPIKLMVDGTSLYVCCEGCIGKVEQDPDLYLRKVSLVAQVNHRPPAAPDRAVAHMPVASAANSTQQGICPVMNQPLGQDGTPIELSVAGRQMFVCCEDCVREVEQHPEVYLRKMAATAQNGSFPPPQARIAVSQATRADFAAAAATAQGFCPVMNQPLGDHGAPIKVEIDGRPLYVCCKGCVDKVEANPDLYLAKVVRGQQPDQHGSQSDWFNHQPKQSTSGSCCSNKGGGGSSCH